MKRITIMAVLLAPLVFLSFPTSAGAGPYTSLIATQFAVVIAEDEAPKAVDTKDMDEAPVMPAKSGAVEKIGSKTPSGDQSTISPEDCPDGVCPTTTYRSGLFGRRWR